MLLTLDLQPSFHAKFEENASLRELAAEEAKIQSQAAQIYMMDLPCEVLLHIFSFMSASDLKCVSCLNRTFNELANSSFAWKQLCQVSFSASLHARLSEHDWKAYYYAKEKIMTQQESFVWEGAPWSKDKWLEAEYNLPSPRMSLTGSVVRDAAGREKIVYIGGQLTSTTRYNDIYFLDTETLKFQKMKVTGNVPGFARMSSVVIENKVYTFGGYDGYSTLFGTFVFDPVALTWESLQCHATTEAPISRTNFACASVGHKMYIHGGNVTIGQTYCILGDLHVLDTRTATWTDLTPLMKGDIPPKRSSHRMVYLRDELYLFGGGVWNPDPAVRWLHKFNDIYTFDLQTYTWTRLQTTGPISVCTFTMPFVSGPFLFLFGGQTMGDTGLCSNDLFCFDSITLQWSLVQCEGAVPKKRDIGCINIVQEKKRAILFAGSSGTPINELNILTLPI